MDHLAAVCERIAATNSRKRKVAYLSAYFRQLTPPDLARAVAFLTHQPIRQHTEAKLSIGHATLKQAALDATGWDEDTFRLCHADCGDTGETISLLLAQQPGAAPLSLELAEEYYVRLLLARPTARRIDLLRDIFLTHGPLAVRYFIKTMSRDLRIGLQEKMVEEAVADSCDVALEAVRTANNKLGLLWQVALAARSGELHAIEARLFHPMDFMLAKPIESMTDLAAPAEWLVEDKYDGIRAQVHRAQGRVAIFTRGQEDATHAFPEIIAALAPLPGSAILDGEVLAWRDQRALPFALLQQRIARKKVPDALRAEIPVVFLAYDILYDNGDLLLDHPLEDRRGRLERQPGILLSPQTTYSDPTDLDRLWTEARARGNEGLVIKRRGSIYEPGKRSGLWCKVKKPYGTLDVVITAAEQGHGRRATMLSDYTFAVRDNDRYVNVGKAYSGLTDDEIRELTKLLRSIATERFGRVVLVPPQVVLEVAFDGVQQSARHKGGYALRFPRILRWRKDKSPAEADTIETVRQMYEASFR